MRKDITKFFASLMLVSLPLLVLIIFYVLSDPFKVLYKYDSFYDNSEKQMQMNRDYTSTQSFVNNFKKYNYDSFIFGSSRSFAFTCKTWTKYIKGSPYHLDAYEESLFGLIGKFRLLRNLRIKINNCLLILDSNLVSQTKNRYEFLFVKHPLVSGENSLRFHYTFLKLFLSNQFFIPFIFWEFGSEPPQYFEYPIIYYNPYITFDTINNDIFSTGTEKQIEENSELYYQHNLHYFSKRNIILREYYPPLLDEVQRIWLTEIKSIFDKNNTQYKIIIYPDYNQKYFNENDLGFLKNTFGKDNIFDFSGINKYTNNMTNYYDHIHCRAKVGDDILQRVYLR